MKKKEGEFQKNRYKEKKWFDELKYGILKPEWVRIQHSIYHRGNLYLWKAGGNFQEKRRIKKELENFRRLFLLIEDENRRNKIC